MSCVIIYRKRDLHALCQFVKLFAEAFFCGLLSQVYDANDVPTLFKSRFNCLVTHVAHDVSNNHVSYHSSPVGSHVPSGHVVQQLFTTRQIIVDVATKYLIPMCAQVLQYHHGSNFNYHSVIWKLIYILQRKIPDPVYKLF